MKTVHSPSGLGINTHSRILFFMPHPDDEAIFCGGFLSELNKYGIQNKLVTLTRGDASTDRHGLSPDVNLGQHRSGELAKAMEILGRTPFVLHDIPDGSIPSSKPRVTSIVRKEISAFKPSHIVTLEPDGIYGHPDHIALSAFVTSCTPKGVKLLYVTVSPKFVPRPQSARMAKKKTIKPVLPEFEYGLPYSATVAKIRALRAHSSQFEIGITRWKTLGRLYKNKLLRSEYFTYYS